MMFKTLFDLPAGMPRITDPVIACDKREAFAQGSAATKQSILSWRGEMDCFAALAMT
jgi:hypothetical protein